MPGIQEKGGEQQMVASILLAAGDQLVGIDTPAIATEGCGNIRSPHGHWARNHLARLLRLTGDAE
jgi:hypothetical protein